MDNKETKKKRLNISIVLYKPDLNQLVKCLKSLNLEHELINKVFLIDNHKFNINNLEEYFFQIEYIRNPSNIGFGPAHNICLKKSINANIDYHLVLNPDIFFNEPIISSISEFMDNNIGVGNLMPRILNEDGSEQNLCKLLPTPFDKFNRVFLKPNLSKYILTNLDNSNNYNIPSLSGCFMFLRVRVLNKIGVFDEKFFLYEEDLDLSRRIFKNFKNIYFPKVSVYHSFNRLSRKNFIASLLHIKSFITYFNKYGWFFDKERKEINRKTLKKINI